MAEGQAVETKGVMPQSGGVFNTLVGTGLGIATANWNDKRQERLSRHIGEQQVRNAKEMAEFNQGLALETWEKTGYGAQRKQLQDAGLNIGLMYGGAGAPGTTQTNAGQMTTGGVPPVNPGELGMGIHSAAAMAMLAAQIENIKADTQVKQKEAGVKEVQKPQIEAETGLTIQKTNNARLDGAILAWEEQIRHIEQRVKDNTEMDVVNAIKLANEKTREDIRAARADANVKQETQDELINQLNRKSEEQALRIQAQQLGLIKTTADINAVNAGIHKITTEVNNMIQSNMREWDKMSQKDKEIQISQKVQEIAQQVTDFNTSTPEQLKQWTSLITSVLTLGIGGGSKPVGFQYK